MTDTKKDDDAKPAKPPEKVVEMKPPVLVSTEDVIDEDIETAKIVCVKCSDTGAVAIETKHNTVTGEDTVEKWGNCTNCYLDKDDAGNYVRRLGVKPDPETLKKELAYKQKVLKAREDAELLKKRQLPVEV